MKNIRTYVNSKIHDVGNVVIMNFEFKHRPINFDIKQFDKFKGMNSFYNLYAK